MCLYGWGGKGLGLGVGGLRGKGKGVYLLSVSMRVCSAVCGLDTTFAVRTVCSF